MTHRECRDCKHSAEWTGVRNNWWITCDRTKVAKDPNGHGPSTLFERSPDGSCGPEGRFWEGK